MGSEQGRERVERAVEAFRRGEMIILVDDEDRENEGDICCAASRVTPEVINFMATHARGLICLAMTGERIDRLQIPLMTARNASPFRTAFTVSIEAREGVSTGISAADRARTVAAAVAPEARPSDLVMPGHIFPLRAAPGGVLARTGQTEGSVDLARLAGLEPAAVICEVMNPDGTMARRPELELFSRAHALPIVSVADLIEYRLERDSLVEIVSERPFPTAYSGRWRARVMRSRLDGATHLCLICGEPSPERAALVRVQRRTDVFDLFVRARSEGYDIIDRAMRMIGEAGEGVFVYLEKPGRGAEEMLAHYLGEEAPSAERALAERNEPGRELRDLGIGAQIVASSGVRQMRLLTNRPRRIIGLDGYGLTIVEAVPIEVGAHGEGERDGNG